MGPQLWRADLIFPAKHHSDELTKDDAEKTRGGVDR